MSPQPILGMNQSSIVSAERNSKEGKDSHATLSVPFLLTIRTIKYIFIYLISFQSQLQTIYQSNQPTIQIYTKYYLKQNI